MVKIMDTLVEGRKVSYMIILKIIFGSFGLPVVRI